jgi:hypothetical protein
MWTNEMKEQGRTVLYIMEEARTENSDGKECWNEEQGMRRRERIIRDDKKCEQRLAP